MDSTATKRYNHDYGHDPQCWCPQSAHHQGCLKILPHISFEKEVGNAEIASKAEHLQGK